MGRTRIVLVRLPRMQLDLLRHALPPDDGLELRELHSGVVWPEPEPGRVVAAVLGGDSPGDPAVVEILARHPEISVLTVSSSGRRAMLHRRDCAPHVFDGLSPAELVRVLREATPE